MLPANQLSGTVLNSSLPANPTFSGTVTANNFFGNGAGVTNVNAITLNGLNSSNFWRTAGNAGTIGGQQFLGTTDDQPLEIKVNGQRVMRFESGIFGTPNVIGGAPSKYVASGVIGATISGGGGSAIGWDSAPNSIAGSFGTIAGGAGNTITNSPYHTIAGGAGNSISGGGQGFSNIGGGANNNIGGQECAIGGGYANTIEIGSGHSLIGGGAYNRLRGSAGTIGGGDDNAIDASWASTIAGGNGNRIGAADYCFVGGGDWNRIYASSESSIIAGGSQNTITNTRAGTISGGEANFLNNCGQATIAGGVNNRILQTAYTSVIAGGGGNQIGTNSPNGVIGGGAGNTLLASSESGTIPGGEGNTATNWAFAAGRAAFATHTGAFVWADSGSSSGDHADLPSTNANSVTMRASGGYRFFTDSFATSGVFLAPGSGSWTSMSDRSAKENFHEADMCLVLEKVLALPVQTWNYKSQDANIRHIGPMAQDFKSAFGLGESDTGISAVDADGVALAAIQGLNQKLEEARAENAELKRRLDGLEQMVRNLAISVDQP
jgi:trimeric autotransporter adhesin